MNDIALDNPITVLVGVGFPEELDMVGRLLDFLADWPEVRRRDTYFAALATCQAARGGKLDAKDARWAFQQFARRAGILWRTAGVPGSNLTSAQLYGG